MLDIEKVRQFWNSNPCGTYLSKENERNKFFNEILSERYKLEWHIPLMAKFEHYKFKKVLEIGCGLGIDGLQFAKNGAIYTGMDLSENSINLAEELFKLNKQKGVFLVDNAENLSFKESEFNHVYSWGVIHHSPNTEYIIKEIYRVLKPGGTFCIMVYNRSSINYYIEIMFLRRIFRQLLRFNLIIKIIAKIGFDKEKIYKHRNLLLSSKKITKEEWISINTDGPDCPLAKVYNKKQVINLFKDFNNVKTEVRFFNKYHWGPFARIIPGNLCKFLGKWWGWHRIVYGIKPDGNSL